MQISTSLELFASGYLFGRKLAETCRGSAAWRGLVSENTMQDAVPSENRAFFLGADGLIEGGGADEALTGRLTRSVWPWQAPFAWSDRKDERRSGRSDIRCEIFSGRTTAAIFGGCARLYATC